MIYLDGFAVKTRSDTVVEDTCVVKLGNLDVVVEGVDVGAVAAMCGGMFSTPFISG